MAKKSTSKKPKAKKKKIIKKAGLTSSADTYGAEKITVLKDLEPVRKRPGMYIGGTSLEGLHHLIWEVVDNSIDEAMAGHCSNITVTLHKGNRITVTDDGRGIPVDKHKVTKKSALETVMTTLHAGGKFGDGGYKVSGGLHGVGISVVNALSVWVRAEIKRDGYIWSQEYERGKAKTKRLKKEKKTKETGTSISFEADPEIFPKIEFSWKKIISHLRQQAYLTKKVKITITDEREGREISPGIPRTLSFYFEGGILSYVKFLNRQEKLIHDNPFYVEKEKDNVLVEVALQYTQEINGIEMSFANNIYTQEGGTHLMGYRTAVTRVINDYARKHGFLKEKDANLTGEDIREGLTAVISIKLPDPQFEGQTKAKLGNSEVRPIVSSVVAEYFAAFLEEHPQDARQMMAKTLLAAKARLAAKAAKDTIIRKGIMEGLTLPGKLADCSSKDPDKSEIYIVEGDSAGGCFCGDTKVALASGRNLSFKELIKENKKGKRNFCYTIRKNGRIGIEKIKNPRITKKNVEVVKIILDNKKEIICTPDHKFMLRNGTYKKATELTPNTSLMPLKRKLSKLGGRITIKDYEMTYDNSTHKWIFTHLLADRWNLQNKVDSINNGSHKHHLDFNKLNNNPTNLTRMTREDHMEYHRKLASKLLHTEAVKEKCKKLRQTNEFQEKMSKRMQEPRTKEILSQQAKEQWKDPEYKEYMAAKFLEFYYSNANYRKSNSKLLNEAQKKHWSKEKNREKQAKRVREFFENNPEQKKLLATIAKEQWNDNELLEWRRQKTKEQWTPAFRKRRKKSYNKTYYRKTIAALREIYDKNKKIDVKQYNQLRKEKNDKTLLKFETFNSRFFNGNIQAAQEAIINYNHKIVKVIRLKKKIDVYDIEVPNTHNFALASGIFVHNSAKQGRDRNFQAILPLRGKILNVERARIDRMLSSKEIKALIIAMGMGVGEEKNIAKLRYNRIIIMTDADVDGAHIRTLLLTFFFRYYPEIIEKGYLYIAQPPLYRIEKNKKKKYAFTEQDKMDIIGEIEEKSKKTQAEKVGFTAKELGKDEPEDKEGEKISGINIQRYKGLGEMNPEQLWETTMDPENRVMLQVKVEDNTKADETFDTLMGDEVEPRKRFIQTHAKKVKNLDI